MLLRLGMSVHLHHKRVGHQLIEEIRELAQELAPSGFKMAGGCVYLAAAGILVLRNHGIEALPQAGDMSWPIVWPKDDNGRGPTHFSYVWEPRSLISITAMRMGKLPEVHAWLGIPKTREIVDLSTRFLVEQCTDTAGLEWKTDPPPDYLWADQLPDGVYYRPVKDATMMVAGMIKEIWSENRQLLSGVACSKG